jgi:hypothetical protein
VEPDQLRRLVDEARAAEELEQADEAVFRLFGL